MTRWRYDEAYIYVSIEQAPFWKNPIKIKLVLSKCQPLPPRESNAEKKRWNGKVKVCLENFVRNVLKENKLWKRTFKPAFWWQ